MGNPIQRLIRSCVFIAVGVTIAMISTAPLTARAEIFNRITFAITTGGDDLRGDSTASATVFTSDGATLAFIPLKTGGQSWDKHTTHSVTAAIPQVDSSSIARIVVSYQSHNSAFESDDNWNVQSVSVFNWSAAYNNLLSLKSLLSPPTPLPTGMAAIQISGRLDPGQESLVTVGGDTTQVADTIPAGPYSVTGFDAQNHQLFSFNFAPRQSADSRGGTFFSYYFPVSVSSVQALRTITLGANGRKVSVSSPPQTLPPTVKISRVGQPIHITWDSSQWQSITVRRASQTQILAQFFTGGSAVFDPGTDSTIIVNFQDKIKELPGYQFAVPPVGVPAPTITSFALPAGQQYPSANHFGPGRCALVYARRSHHRSGYRVGPIFRISDPYRKRCGGNHAKSPCHV